MYLFLNNLSKYYDYADEDTGLRTVPSSSVGAESYVPREGVDLGTA